MKTAFVTSVLGTGAGLAVKILGALSRSAPDGAGEQKGVEDVLAALAAIRQDGRAGREEVVAATERVRLALSGENDGSLVTQVQRLRVDVTDELRTLRAAGETSSGRIVDEIRSLSATLARDTTGAFIQALEGAIKDFNRKISEQFGENFKELNVAVGRLLAWQENYRTQMETNAAALQDGAAGLQAARAGLDAITMQAGHLVRCAEEMRELLRGLDTQRADLEEGLSAFGEMASQARGAMPLIQERIEALTDGFAREVGQALEQAREGGAAMQEAALEHQAALREGSVRFAQAVAEAAAEARGEAGAALRTLQETLEQAANAQEAQRRSFEGLADGFATLRTDAAAAGEATREAIRASSEATQQVIAATAEAGQKAAADTAQQVAAQLRQIAEAQFRGVAEGLNKQILEFEQALEGELKRALEAFAGQLVSLSGQFVEDYGPLTERLREVVAMARKVEA